MIRGGIVGGLYGNRGGGDGTVPNASRVRTNTDKFGSFLSTSDDTVQKALDELDDIEAHLEFALVLPNTYTYTRAQRTIGGNDPIEIWYQQVATSPTIDGIDEIVPTSDWTKTRPTDSTVPIWYIVAYNDGTDPYFMTEPAELGSGEQLTLYFSTANLPDRPADGTETPTAPWVATQPQQVGNTAIWYTVRAAFEHVPEWHEGETDTDTEFRVRIGKIVSEGLHLPLTPAVVSKAMNEVLDAALGDAIATLPGTGTAYPWSDSRSRSGDQTTRTILINGNQNIFRADFTTEQQEDIAAGAKYTLVLEALNSLDGIHGSPPRIDIIINSGNKTERYPLQEDTITEVEFEIPNAANVFSVGVRAEGTWKGAGITSGNIRVVSAELRTKGSREDEFNAWYRRQYAIVSTEAESFANIPIALARLIQGIAGTFYREPTAADIQAHNIVSSASDTGILTVTGDFIDVRFYAVDSSTPLSPVSSRRVGPGRYEYIGPRNRPLYRIADIPSLWALDRTVTTLIAGVQQSISQKLTEIEETLQAIQQNPASTALRNFEQYLSQQTEILTAVTLWMAAAGFNIAGMAILADDPNAHNRIPADQSSIVLTAPRQLDAAHILDAPLQSNYADAGFEHIVVSGWFDFSEDTGFQTQLLRIGYLTAVGQRKILERNTHGVIGWNRRTAASGEQSVTVDQTITTRSYRPNGYFDNTATATASWDIPAGVNTVKMTLNLTENGNPMQAEQTIDVNTTADRALGEQTVNFTDSLGNTRAVRVRWSYTLSTRRLIVESGAARLPSYSEYNARAHVTIDVLTVVVSQSVTRTIHTSEQTQFIPLSPVSGTSISTSSEDAHFIIMMVYRNAAGNAEGAIVTRERTSGTVISYQRQDLGIPFAELQIWRLLIGDFRIKQSDSFIAYPERDPYTDTELRTKATAAAFGLGEVTAGSTHEVSLDEFVLNSPLRVTKLIANELFVGTEEIGKPSERFPTVSPVGETGDAANQYDITRQRVFVSLKAGAQQKEVEFFLDNIPSTGTVIYTKRIDGPDRFIVNVSRVAGETNRLMITIANGSVAGSAIVSVREE